MLAVKSLLLVDGWNGCLSGSLSVVSWSVELLFVSICSGAASCVCVCLELSKPYSV